MGNFLSLDRSPSQNDNSLQSQVELLGGDEVLFDQVDASLKNLEVKPDLQRILFLLTRCAIKHNLEID